jgi:hypothetical protein
LNTNHLKQLILKTYSDHTGTAKDFNPGKCIEAVKFADELVERMEFEGFIKPEQ